MSRRLHLWLSLPLLPALAGTLALCSVPGAPGAEAASRVFVFAHSRGDSRVYGYQMDSRGKLKQLPNSPFNGGDDGGAFLGQCQSIAYSAKRKLLFVGGLTGLSVMRVATSGNLTRIPQEPVGGGDTVSTGVVELRNSTFVYAVDYDANAVRGYRVSSNGSLTPVPGEPIATLNGPASMAVSRDKLYIVNEANKTVSAFKVQANGSLVEAPGSPYAVGTNPASLVFSAQVSADFKYLMVPDDENAVVQVFLINADASLSPVVGSPFDGAGITAGAGTAGKTKLYAAYDAGEEGSNVVIFKQGRTGALQMLGAPKDLGMVAQAGAWDPTGKLLVLGDDEIDVIQTYKVSTTNGNLVRADSKTAIMDGLNALLVVKR